MAESCIALYRENGSIQRLKEKSKQKGKPGLFIFSDISQPEQ